jgi:NAD-dependent dihydropyrimidine dehydrogenase PreA subunit
MKSIVIYYSQSGNTKKISEAIHEGMKQSGEQCDIARLREVETKDLAGYDLIGVGSPVMNLQEYAVVTEFIQFTIKNVDGKHGFAFCTHGALPAYCLARMVSAMAQKALTIIGWADWFCDVVYPVTPVPYFTAGHPDKIDLKEAGDFGREMVERSRRIYQGETQLIPTFPKGREYDEIYVPPEVELPPHGEEWERLLKAIGNTEFKLNKDKCKYPKCTLCIDNCPNHSIDFSVDPPTFSLNCNKCWLCGQICPNDAIEVDWEPFKLAHDPFTISLLQRSLEIFEARGRFRRLVPLKDIGWDTPFYKTKKPPRFKVA